MSDPSGPIALLASTITAQLFLVGFLVATVFLASRPPRGPSSIDVSPYLQGLTLAVCLLWGLLSAILVPGVLAVPSTGFAVFCGLAGAVASLLVLGRPWTRARLAD